jgi:hypothetical protein
VSNGLSGNRAGSEVTLESLIRSYGYWAILISTFVEGETILVLGGLAAFRVSFPSAGSYTGGVYRQPMRGPVVLLLGSVV